MELYVDTTTSLRTLRLYKIEYWGVHLGTAVSFGGGSSGVTELHTVFSTGLHGRVQWGSGRYGLCYIPRLVLYTRVQNNSEGFIGTDRYTRCCACEHLHSRRPVLYVTGLVTQS